MAVEGELAGHVALVTGGAGGIGQATAVGLAKQGVHVVVLDRDVEGAQQAVDEIVSQGLKAEPVVVDLANLDQLPGLVERLHARLGRIDILVNCAGISGERMPLLELELKSWDRTIAVDLTAPFLLLQSCARAMVAGGRGGRIVNVVSSSAFRAGLTDPDYAAAKNGLVGLTRAAAGQLAQYDINVNSVAPGMTLTTMSKVLDDEVIQRMVESGPLENLFHRVSTPEDVAAAIVFLCLPGSRQITAQTIHTSAGAVVT